MGRYPWAELILFQVLRIIVFYPTRHRTYTVSILVASFCLAAKIYLTPDIANPVGAAYGIGQQIGFHFLFVAYILLAEGPFPDHWRRVRDEVRGEGDAHGSANLPSNFPLVKKIYWMLDLTNSCRMVGWVQEPRSRLPKHPQTSRRTFLLKKFLQLVANFITHDLTSLVLAGNPAFDSRVHDPTDGPEAYLAAIPLLRRVPHVLAFGLWVAMAFHIMFNAAGLLCVGLGLSSPDLWPDIWGRWGDGYTVRRLWGRTWHQMLRPTVSGLGKLVANKIFKFPRGSQASSYTQLYVAFFLSGLFHLAGEAMYERQLVYHSVKFFTLQAVFITFEDFIIFLMKRSLAMVGIKLEPGKAKESCAEVAVRVIGYCWVILWFSLMLPMHIDESCYAGFCNTDRGVISQFLLDMWQK